MGVSTAWDIHGVFVGYSWGIHMCRLCIGYVSVMCRLRDGGNEEQGVRKKQVKNGANHGRVQMGTETRDMIPPTPMARDPNYLNHKRGYLSTMRTIIFNNKNYKHPMARAPRNLNYLN